MLYFQQLLSAQGIEQLAAILPRTNSEILQIDSMTPDKFEVYGPQLMPILQKYWKQLDDLEHTKIKNVVSRF